MAVDCISHGHGSSVAELPLTAGHWRSTTSSAEVYTCPQKAACLGSSANATTRRRLLANDTLVADDGGETVTVAGDASCAKGHVGPRCEVCARCGSSTGW